MSERVASMIGSGTLPYTRGILPASQRGNEPLGEGVRTGSQVIVANFEDNYAADAFSTFDIDLPAATATLIVGPSTNPLPRSRTVYIQNLGTGNFFIGHNDSVSVSSGFLITEGEFIKLELLHNVEVWGIAGGTRDIRVLIY